MKKVLFLLTLSMLSSSWHVAAQVAVPNASRYTRASLLFDPQNNDAMRSTSGGALLVQFARLIQERQMPIVTNGSILYNYLSVFDKSYWEKLFKSSVDKLKDKVITIRQATQEYKSVERELSIIRLSTEIERDRWEQFKSVTPQNRDQQAGEIKEDLTKVLERLSMDLPALQSFLATVDRYRQVHAELKAEEKRYDTLTRWYMIAGIRRMVRYESGAMTRLRQSISEKKKELTDLRQGISGILRGSIVEVPAYSNIIRQLEAEHTALVAQADQLAGQMRGPRTDIERRKELLLQLANNNRRRREIKQELLETNKRLTKAQNFILKQEQQRYEQLEKAMKKKLLPAEEAYAKQVRKDGMVEVQYYIRELVGPLDMNAWRVYAVPGSDLYVLIPINYLQSMSADYLAHRAEVAAYIKPEDDQRLSKYGADSMAVGMDLASLKQLTSPDDIRASIRKSWGEFAKDLLSRLFFTRVIDPKAVTNIFIKDDSVVVRPHILYLAGYGQASSNLTGSRDAMIAGFSLRGYQAFISNVSDQTAFLYYVSCFGGDVNLSLVDNYITNSVQEQNIRRAIFGIQRRPEFSVAAGAIMNARTFARATLTPVILDGQPFPLNFNQYTAGTLAYLTARKGKQPIASQENALRAGLNAISPSFSRDIQTIDGVSSIPALWRGRRFEPLVSPQDQYINDTFITDNEDAGVATIAGKRSILIKSIDSNVNAFGVSLILKIGVEPSTGRLPSIISMIPAEVQTYLQEVRVDYGLSKFLKESMFTTVIALDKSFYFAKMLCTNVVPSVDAGQTGIQSADELMLYDSQGKLQGQVGYQETAPKKILLEDLIVDIKASKSWWSRELGEPSGTIMFKVRRSNGRLALYEGVWDPVKQTIRGNQWKITEGDKKATKRELEILRQKFQYRWARWIGYTGSYGYPSSVPAPMVEKIEKLEEELAKL